ncbi:hypothetical protein MKW94_028882 [Papaver nudicaule]|uniref:Cyclin-L1-1 n=1 Tax=Papaver nudicaule TaxID=74823 RepID=A0AA42B134_PAPNU|nr:hypothetical protein [Papaver nudicaule]
MSCTTINTFYLTDEQLKNTPSRKDGVDESMETTLRVYGFDLIQEGGILLQLPQEVMATGQVLFHRFYCKKSFARFNVKRVAASCVWLASKLEESPRRAEQVLIVFHRMECRRENLPIEHLYIFSKKYPELEMDLVSTERHLLKEMGFICHVEHPHKFISNYLATLRTPNELRQEAWNLANDSLRTTLCVRFKSEVIACGVVYAAARRFQVPLPENPPWWEAFDVEKSGIDEVCRVLAHLYSMPKAQYIPVCETGDSSTPPNKSWDTQTLQILKEGSMNGTAASAVASSVGTGDSKNLLALEKMKEKGNDDVNSASLERETLLKLKAEKRIEGSGERSRFRRERERVMPSDSDRRRDSDRERERVKAERESRNKLKEKSGRSEDRGRDSRGYTVKSRHHQSRDRGTCHSSSYSSRDTSSATGQYY